MSRLGDIIKGIITPFGQELTMSKTSWNSGTCTITNVSKYSLLSMTVGGDPVIAYRVDNQFRFIGVTGSSSQYVKDGYFNMDGDTCTYGAAIQLTHNASGNHGSPATNQAITKVIGLVPYWGGGLAHKIGAANISERRCVA